ncbi:LD-carboxypeptidase [Thalassotalea sp. PS06]|uniref:LD-carboxypeptidase n=1 Tax=Thalassotalea sp. PS06 TaxID=2594005 RepID=UPI0011645B0F|nr:LD-carboxypeptidase [Thalassotalea sp. PS06]QDP01961.1 LD-carboxypeptidase [Thalassotalea sp. PS06]
MKLAILTALVAPLLLLTSCSSNAEKKAVKPYKPLTVDLISISSSFDETKVESLKEKLERLGMKVNTRYFDQTISDLGYVNVDENRVASLINAIKAPDSDLVWFIRGGAGALNLLPALEQYKEELKQQPGKPIIGYSDVTAIHHFLNNSVGWPSVHGIVAAYNREIEDMSEEPVVPEKEYTSNARESIARLHQSLYEGVYYDRLLPLNDAAKSGVSGELRGGNLTLFQATIGTRFEADLTGKILVLEDVNEGYRKIDRMLHHLEYADNLNAAGVVFGQFHSIDAKDEERLIFKTVLENYAKRVDIPVYYYPKIGHGFYNHPVFLGKTAELACVDKNYCSLTQDKLLGE